MKKYLFLLLALNLFCRVCFATNAYYIRDTDPWNHTFNQMYMNLVFGVASWAQGDYSTPAATIFVPTVRMVFLEGSDSNALALQQFLTTNQSTIENWVNSGGHLLINASPAQGNDINAGFNGTVIHYPYLDSIADAADAGHSIYHCPYVPIATHYTGSYISRAYISGTGLHDILKNSAYPILSEKSWGSGFVVFGSLSDKSFWTPGTQAGNMFENLVYYVADSIPCYGTDVRNVNSGIPAYKIYPNPSGGQLTISSGVGAVSVSIINAIGQVLIEQKSYSDKASIDVSSLSCGIYFIKLVDKQGRSTVKRFIKE
jgi:hypothetical protein